MIDKKYIAIEGAIGVGKTTLAKKISDTVKCKTLFEDYVTNPFLKDFYDTNQLNSFSTQVHFLLRRIEQSIEVKGTENLLISDFYFGKDEIFAKLNLTQAEYAMYQELRKKLDFKIIDTAGFSKDLSGSKKLNKNFIDQTKKKNKIISNDFNSYGY